ncbi:sulfite exporter TauE/SafE family protein [Ferroplasma acidiphilum]|jgi:hypothetical protein|uniref:Probable membrane transporter protein n=2 Tax=Ferroplasma TaxID=74968 RepID=S0AU33_FERAC|nr:MULTISPECIES: sulfite exporter TauE/SafE family protein [Ferroplasma]AGO61865.1 permease [Ferroplasma acidarmanus Fer1]ARD84747.1 transporter of sulfur-containing compounds [Ferroplasma acidiphilum]NOL61068.1 sulfite exporter TauE/SafE family protein [Ferroplasma acidiphilum]
MFYLFYLEFIILGIIVGALTGVLGSSGVVAVVPALIIINSELPQEAIGTSLLIDVITSVMVAYVYFKRGRVNIKKGIPMILGAIIGSQIGVRIAFLIPAESVKIGFAVFIIAMGIYSLIRRKEMQNTKDTQRLLNIKPWEIVLITIPVGLATGILGASGGIMFLIISILILKLDIKTAVGTSTFSMIISASSGTVGYLIAGHIMIIAALIIGSISILSGLIFSRIGNNINPLSTYKILGTVFIIIGIVQIVL